MKRFALLALFAVCGSAHEIGTTRVTVVFGDSQNYDIEIVTDATALGEKLESVAGRNLASNASVAKMQALLAGSEEVFRQRIRVMFDGTEVRPDISYALEPPADATSAMAAIIHLQGSLPQGAHTFTWSFGWTFASYAITIRHNSETNLATQWLDGGQTSAAFALGSAATPAVSRWQTARRYLTLGFTHIVPNGLDHMLFVLGIYLLSKRPRSVLLQVSAFTLAHSITLGLSMYGLLTVAPRIVEPMIAVSIAYVAIENIFLSELKTWRVALVFGFGLLHGLGFAGALKELGLPRSEFVTALLTFNIGVEAGQLSVIAIAFLLVGWQWSNRVWYRPRVVIPTSAAIACTALYWTVQRAFF
jgi:hydrogenase/urease accessory protein HupE